MSGICLYNLLEIMGKTEEIELIKNKYNELGLNTKELYYTFSYRGGLAASEKNSISFKIIEMLRENEDIKNIFDDIWTGKDSESRINAALITVEAEDLEFFKRKISLQLSVVKKSMLPPDAFDGILYAVIALKIYCERLKKNLILPEITNVDGSACNELDAKIDFDALNSNSNPPFHSYKGRQAAEIFNFKARAACQFGNAPILPMLMQKLQLVGKMISYLSKFGCLDRPFTKEVLISDHVPNDFRPAAVKFIVNNFVQGLPEKNGKLSMFNPTGGWGGRLIGALATPEISRYVETDPNPDLLDIKNRIVSICGSVDKNIFVHQRPIELLSKEDYCPCSQHFSANERHDFSLFSPPYFNVEKYKDQIENNHQSYNQYSVLENWIRDFLLVLIDINYRALRVSGMMIINVAPINVKLNLIGDLINLNNMYPECINKSKNPTNHMVIDIPKIIKIELNRGLRNRQWEHQRDLAYASNDTSNVVMFFKSKSPLTPLYRKFTHNFKTSPNCKRKLPIEEIVTEETDLKKLRLGVSV